MVGRVGNRRTRAGKTIVTPVYRDPRAKASEQFAFTVKNGEIVETLRFGSHEPAEKARKARAQTEKERNA